MTRALITGVNGFAGRYLAKNLIDNGYEVWGGVRNGSINSVSGIKAVKLSYKNPAELAEELNDIQPEAIFHLSGQSSVRKSWDAVHETFSSNLMDTIGLLEGLRHSHIRQNATLLTIGSSEEYGFGASSPIREENTANPSNPYGLSKYTVGSLSLMYSQAYDLKIIHTRSFNHIGPGQLEGFVTSDFAKQVAEIALGKAEPVMYVGDLSSKRDFTDVRDIVQAYRLLYEHGEPGQVYNVCSGTCIAIHDILEMFLSFVDRKVEVVKDQRKFRPNNIPEYYGSNDKIKLKTGWKPEIPIRQSLYDIYHDWLTDRL